jgi:intracellular multiplication protein IcmB
MAKIVDSLLDGVDSFLAWLSTSLKQTTESYSDLETADSPTVLVAHDGSLVLVIKIIGVTTLIGIPEFERLHEGLSLTLQTALSRAGHALQVFFLYDGQIVAGVLEEILKPAMETSKRLNLALEDLFEERVKYLSNFCAYEAVYFVLWTRPSNLTSEQQQRASKDKIKLIREKKIPPFKRTQNLVAPIPDLRDTHDAFVRSVSNDLAALNISATLLEVHDALHDMRAVIDPEYTDLTWKPSLPGDKVPLKEYNKYTGDVSDLFWPSLARQLLPRDAENLDLRTVRIGDRIYSCVFIDLLPKELKPFMSLFQRTLAAKVPWRISFFIESQGLTTIRFKSLLASILSFSSAENRLLSDSNNLLNYIAVNTDDPIVRLRVVATTWAPEGNIPL